MRGMNDSLHAPRIVTLAALVEHIARGREHRDRDFVRDLSAWLHERGERLRLPQIERLGLVDVVCTFHMKDRVALVVTGHPDGSPFEITARVDEREFPFVEVEVTAEPVLAPYDFCTLDFGLRGVAVRLVAPVEGRAPGTSGTCVVVSTMGGASFVRAAVDPGGQVATWPLEAVVIGP
jgi:hypothetical protein